MPNFALLSAAPWLGAGGRAQTHLARPVAVNPAARGARVAGKAKVLRLGRLPRRACECAPICAKISLLQWLQGLGIVNDDRAGGPGTAGSLEDPEQAPLRP